MLVNNAGKEGFKKFLQITPEAWDELLRINLTGTFHCCQLVLPDMLEAGWGRIVNISSSSTHGGTPYMAHYVSSKSGVVGLTKVLALEFGPSGITVNTIPPGFIDTPMSRRSEAEGKLGPGGMEAATAQTPGAARRATRGHRRRVRVPRVGRGELRHRPDHRRERRTQHLTLCAGGPGSAQRGSAAARRRPQSFRRPLGSSAARLGSIGSGTGV